jgi:hypothetical protein
VTRSTTVRKAAAQNARERAAVARLEARRRAQRRRLMTLAGSVAAVVAVVVGLVTAALVSGSGGSASPTGTAASADRAAKAVAAVPAVVLDSIGRGQGVTPPAGVNDPPLTSGGRPEVLYVGAEFCPYCAAERWALVQALSRFGTFHGLKASHSSPTDQFPNTATFSFSGSAYTSDLVSFTGRELQTLTGAPLDTATARETELWRKYTGSPGTYPFVDIAGRYVSTHPSYDPQVLQGLTVQQIADALSDPASPVARSVDGAANALTAAICRVTGQLPIDVCSAAGVRAYAGAVRG